MLSVTEAIEITLEHTRVANTENLALLDAAGCVLAEDIISDLDMPPFDKSSMDGYALRAADCQQVPANLQVVGTIPAGTMPEFEVKAGQAAKIMTGAPMPVGADSVQMIEKTQENGDFGVQILESIAEGKNVAQKGEIMQTGQPVLSEGVRLGSSVVGLLAAVGKTSVEVYRRPSVGILVTGDELVEVDTRPGPGQIRNSNGYALHEQVKAVGARPALLGIATDDLQDLRRLIGQGLQHDVLLISGGVSMGEFDLVEDVLAEYDIQVHYDKVNIKPGKPTVFGNNDRCLVFGLPGNPVSASTVFEVIVRPALRKMMGFRRLHSYYVDAILDDEFRSKTARDNYHPAYTVFRDGRFYASPVKSKGSADILAFARSNSYIIASGDRDHFAMGKQILAMLRDDFWREGFQNQLQK